MTDDVATVACMFCGEPVRVVDSKHAMPHHDGCAGYPYCTCPTPHRGDCMTDRELLHVLRYLGGSGAEGEPEAAALEHARALGLAEPGMQGLLVLTSAGAARLEQLDRLSRVN